jgi:hypothetical protein
MNGVRIKLNFSNNVVIVALEKTLHHPNLQEIKLTSKKSDIYFKESIWQQNQPKKQAVKN